MAASKTRSSNLTEEPALSVAKQMNDFIKNSTVFKEAILKAFNSAVQDLNEEIASLQNEVKKLKSELIKASAKANMTTNSIPEETIFVSLGWLKPKERIVTL